MKYTKIREALIGLVEFSSLLATISFDGLVKKLPEFEDRVNQIDISYYDFLYMTGCIYSGLLHLKMKFRTDLPVDLLNTVFDPEIISPDRNKSHQYGTVSEAIDARYDRWFADGNRAVDDLEVFIDRSKMDVDKMEDNVYTFLIGRWFLWNLFGKEPTWASIETCSIIGGSMFFGGVKILTDSFNFEK
ncbi:MAG: hypothetical protein HN936_01955 [Bacteroidetes bacterium]|jgi:hypothetical protein|nr:hypothetical protein [Bacteroidota bacterium]